MATNVDISKLNEEQREKLFSISSNSELKKMLESVNSATKAVDDNDETAMLSMLGCDSEIYEVGNAKLKPVTAGVYALLSEIESPFVVGGDFELSDAYVALYICAVGAEAVSPIMGMKQRVRAAEKRKSMMKKVDEFEWDSYVDNIIANAYAAIETAAFEWIEKNVGNANPADVVSVVNDMLRDAISGFGLLPEAKDADEVDGESKNA